MSEEILENIQSAIDQFVDSQMEYEESHDDALGNYIDCMLADSMTFHDGDQKLADWLEEHHEVELTKHEQEWLSEQFVLYCEAGTAHLYSSPGNDSGQFVFSLAEIGEKEIEIPLYWIAQETGYAVEVIRETLEETGTTQFNGDYVLEYGNSDLIVVAKWDAESILDALEELRDQLA